MLKAISWQEYFVFLFVILILYYTFLFIFYFRSNFSSLRKVSRITFSSSKESNRVPGGNAQQIIEEIGPSFRGKQNVHELIYDLQIKLEPYKSLDEPGFREMINAFIIEESEKKCSVHLSEEDLRVLWL